MGTASDAKQSVMGTAHDVSNTGSDRAHDAAEAVREVPDVAMRQTRGNPLAAGAVALAAGWLVGSLLPASQKERELAAAAKDQAQPLVDEAKNLASETAAHLKEPAQQAVESVKETAREGVEAVRDDGGTAAQNVKETASSSTRGGSSGPAAP